MSFLALSCSVAVIACIAFLAKPSVNGALFPWHPTLMASGVLGKRATDRGGARACAAPAGPPATRLHSSHVASRPPLRAGKEDRDDGKGREGGAQARQPAAHSIAGRLSQPARIVPVRRRGKARTAGKLGGKGDARERERIQGFFKKHYCTKRVGRCIGTPRRPAAS